MKIELEVLRLTSFSYGINVLLSVKNEELVFDTTHGNPGQLNLVIPDEIGRSLRLNQIATLTW